MINSSFKHWRVHVLKIMATVVHIYLKLLSQKNMSLVFLSWAAMLIEFYELLQYQVNAGFSHGSSVYIYDSKDLVGLIHSVISEVKDFIDNSFKSIVHKNHIYWKCILLHCWETICFFKYFVSSPVKYHIMLKIRPENEIGYLGMRKGWYD